MAPTTKEILQRSVSMHNSADLFAKGARAFLMKSATAANSSDDVNGSDLRKLAENFLASIRYRNLLDAVARYALPIPSDQHRVMIASGTLAGEVAEAAPKAVTRANLNASDMTKRKVAALLVCTAELLRSGDAAWMRLFRMELESSLINASNTSMLGAIGTTTIPETGDALDDLAAGLAAVDDSTGYIVAGKPSVVRELALKAEGRMSATQGGEFAPDARIIPVAGVNNLIVIPASRVMLQFDRIDVRNTSDADIYMADDPESPGELTSMFQTNSKCLLVERRYRIHSNSNAVAVEGT